MEFILENEPVTVKELKKYFTNHISTYHRWFNELKSSGLVKKIANNKKPKLKKHAQYIYQSTPRLKLVLNSTFHWIANLALKDNKVELTDPLNLEFQNEIISFFSDIVFPEIREWTTDNWEEYSDPLPFLEIFQIGYYRSHSLD